MLRIWLPPRVARPAGGGAPRRRNERRSAPLEARGQGTGEKFLARERSERPEGTPREFSAQPLSGRKRCCKLRAIQRDSPGGAGSCGGVAGVSPSGGIRNCSDDRECLVAVGGCREQVLEHGPVDGDFAGFVQT